MGARGIVGCPPPPDPGPAWAGVPSGAPSPGNSNPTRPSATIGREDPRSHRQPPGAEARAAARSRPGCEAAELMLACPPPATPASVPGHRPGGRPEQARSCSSPSDSQGARSATGESSPVRTWRSGAPNTKASVRGVAGHGQARAGRIPLTAPRGALPNPPRPGGVVPGCAPPALRRGCHAARSRARWCHRGLPR